MYLVKQKDQKSYFEGITLGMAWWTSRIGDAKHYEKRKDAKDIADRLARSGCRYKLEIVKEA